MHDNSILDISVCLCTYKRPELLNICLEHLLRQVTTRSYEIIVVDNDFEGSAKDRVNSFQEKVETRGIQLWYFVEPEQNIALARNKGVVACKGDYVAFIDDDEYAETDWLQKHYETLVTTRADGVFGPIIPVFPLTFPNWMKSSRLFRVPHRPTGMRMRGGFATNNALVKKSALLRRTGPFWAEFGLTGGEDTDLFNWLDRQGCQFYWCDNAIVYEHQDLKRSKWLWHIRRGYRGGWGYSKQLCEVKGPLHSLLQATGWAMLGSMKAVVEFIMGLHHPRAASLYFLSKMAGQIGKMGYFAGFKLEGYKK